MTPGAGLPGWERLRHGGLLLDGARLEAVSRHGNAPAPLDAHTERRLRQRASAMLDGAGAGRGESGDGGTSAFVAFVLEQVCGFDASTGAWSRGSNVAPIWRRRAVTGETIKPRHLWETRGTRKKFSYYRERSLRKKNGGGRKNRESKSETMQRSPRKVVIEIPCRTTCGRRG